MFLIGRVWVRVTVVTIVSLSKTLNHDCLVKVVEVVISALPARLLMDDTQDYVRIDCKGVALFQPQELVATAP